LPFGIKFPGEKNTGILEYTKDGMMIASLKSEPTKVPYNSSFYDNHFEYSGNFSLNQNVIYHQVKDAVPASWKNTTLKRIL
jgi:Lipocalin-like domain